MPEEIWQIHIAQDNGRAYVAISEEISTLQIRNTCIAISMNERWKIGDGSTVWHVKMAFFSDSFEFKNILQTIQTTKAFFKPELTAIVIDRKSNMQNSEADFFKSIASVYSNRRL